MNQEGPLLIPDLWVIICRSLSIFDVIQLSRCSKPLYQLIRNGDRCFERHEQDLVKHITTFKMTFTHSRFYFWIKEMGSLLNYKRIISKWPQEWLVFYVNCLVPFGHFVRFNSVTYYGCICLDTDDSQIFFERSSLLDRFYMCTWQHNERTGYNMHDFIGLFRLILNAHDIFGALTEECNSANESAWETLKNKYIT